MITIHVSAVCRVRDGFTGKAMAPSALVCTLDGAPCRPVGKPEGYLVLTGLPEGTHRLSLRCHGYQEEWVEFDTGRGTRELDVTMKPGEGYPFRQAATRLTLTLLAGDAPAAGRQLWLAAPGPAGLKIAQARVEAGDTGMRIFSKGGAAGAAPGTYLIADGADSEIVLLRALEGETGELLEPLRHSHNRGRALLPAQRYHTGEDGTLRAAFPGPCALEVCGDGGALLASLELAQGENRQTIRLS